MHIGIDRVHEEFANYFPWDSNSGPNITFSHPSLVGQPNENLNKPLMKFRQILHTPPWVVKIPFYSQ